MYGSCFSRDLYQISPTQEVADLLVEVSEEVLKLLESNPAKISPFMPKVLELLTNAWSSCEDRHLTYISELWSITSIAVSIYKNSDASSNQALSQVSADRWYEKSERFYDISGVLLVRNIGLFNLIMAIFGQPCQNEVHIRISKGKKESAIFTDYVH